MSGVMAFKRLGTIGSPSPLSPQTGLEGVPAKTLITFFHGDGVQEVRGLNSGAPPSLPTIPPSHLPFYSLFLSFF